MTPINTAQADKNGWMPIETVDKEATTLGREGRYYVDLYSKARNIFWPRCFWEGDLWVSRQQFIDELGRRNTRFYYVEKPSHWRKSPAPPVSEGGDS
jgi:hypothetical protein